MNSFSLPASDSETTPIKETSAYKWFTSNPNLRSSSNMDLVCEYLDSLGFVTGEDKVTEDELSRLNLFCEEAYRNRADLNGTVDAGDLFEPVTDEEWKETAYYEKDLFNPFFSIDTLLANDLEISAGKYRATALLVDLIRQEGCIYEINPFNIYFQVITTVNGDKNLHYKYQYIIGGRKLCRIK